MKIFNIILGMIGIIISCYISWFGFKIEVGNPKTKPYIRMEGYPLRRFFRTKKQVCRKEGHLRSTAHPKYPGVRCLRCGQPFVQISEDERYEIFLDEAVDFFSKQKSIINSNSPLNNSKMKLIDSKVFPSEFHTVKVREDDIYGGAHEYFVQNSCGFNNGVTEYVDSYQAIRFVKKLDDGTIVPGIQDQQLVLILLDRTRKVNARFPCPQNEKMMAGLQMFLDACKERIEDRMSRGVMGELKK